MNDYRFSFFETFGKKHNADKKPDIQALIEADDLFSLKMAIDQDPDAMGILKETLPLHYAASHGAFHILRFLLDIGITGINDLDEHGRTALMLAAFSGHLKIARYLLEHGADVNIASDTGATALSYAKDTHNAEMVDLLMPYDPDR